MDYTTLNALPPEAFREHERFVTGFDVAGDDYAKEQYAKGLQVSAEYAEVDISANGTWGARGTAGQSENTNDASVSSSEGIGYHRGTADLLRGFLDGPAPIYVHRHSGEGITRTCIKPRTDVS